MVLAVRHPVRIAVVLAVRHPVRLAVVHEVAAPHLQAPAVVAAAPAVDPNAARLTFDRLLFFKTFHRSLLFFKRLPQGSLLLSIEQRSIDSIRSSYPASPVEGIERKCLAVFCLLFWTYMQLLKMARRCYSAKKG